MDQSRSSMITTEGIPEAGFKTKLFAGCATAWRLPAQAIAKVEGRWAYTMFKGIPGADLSEK